MNSENPLASAKWLYDNLSNEEIVILDATMDKTVSNPSFLNGATYIPGARKFDLEKVFSNPNGLQAHTMPTEDMFTLEVRKLGVDLDSIIVIYDVRGVYSSPRAWWMFKCMGYDNVYVLDGGLSAWKAYGYPTVDSLVLNTKIGSFKATYKKGTVYSSDDVLKFIGDNSVAIIDVRSSSRFQGLEVELREGVRSGHIPSSLNIPFPSVLKDDRYQTLSTLVRLFEHHEVTDKKTLVFSCGSGVTACIVLLAAYLVGYKKLALYDGSWSEWGADVKLPIACVGGS